MTTQRQISERDEREPISGLRVRRRPALALSARVGLWQVLLSGSLWAGDAVKVVPVDESFAGTTYEELVVAWWDWGLNSGPLGCNPIQDPTGEYAKVNQGRLNPEIFWLAGSFAIPEGPRVVRDVPEDVYFFIPILNTVHWVPEDGPDLPSVRASAAQDVDDLVNGAGSFFELTVDGEVVASDAELRSDFRLLGDGMLTFDCPGNLGCDFVETYQDRVSAADGIWVVLEPLPPGPHEIRILSQIPASDFNVDVTYDLWVGPMPEVLPLGSVERTGESIFELTWTGGPGNIEGSEDGTTWSLLAAEASSPETVVVDLEDKPSQLFRVVTP